MKLKKIFTALALAAAAVTSANAFVLYPGLTQLEDDNIEQLIKGAGNVSASLQIGDRLRGVLEFPIINQVSAPFDQQLGITPELTGIFDTEIKNIINIGVNGAGQATGTIIWGPTASFVSTYGPGAMVAMFTGGLNLNVNSCHTTSVAFCEGRATDGALWAVAGFGDLDDLWVSTDSVLDISAVATTAASTDVASVNYFLSILTNNTGYQFGEQVVCAVGCAGDGLTDIIGSGTIQGGSGLGSGYIARSDIQLQLNVIPEPGSLALFALALVGLGFSSRRRS